MDHSCRRHSQHHHHRHRHLQMTEPVFVFVLWPQTVNRQDECALPPRQEVLIGVEGGLSWLWVGRSGGQRGWQLVSHAVLLSGWLGEQQQHHRAREY